MLGLALAYQSLAWTYQMVRLPALPLSFVPQLAQVAISSTPPSFSPSHSRHSCALRTGVWQYGQVSSVLKGMSPLALTGMPLGSAFVTTQPKEQLNQPGTTKGIRLARSQGR